MSSFTSLADIIERDSEITDPSDVEYLSEEDMRILIKYPEKFDLRGFEVDNIKVALYKEYGVDVKSHERRM